jgi:glycopeptide antibiotics resistance protein
MAEANPAPFPTRRAYLLCAVAFSAFAVYGSLLPFDLHPVSVGAAWDQFRAAIVAVQRTRLSRSDVLANILLFVPIGFTLAGGLLLDRRRRVLLVAAAALILPFSVAVSATAEFLQVFSQGRVPSPLDIAAQTVGSAIGVLAWALVGPALTQWIREAVVASGEDRLSRLLTTYAAAWLFFSLAPFDITVDLGDLAERVRSGKIALAPFSNLTGGARQLWDIAAEVISAAPLGALGAIGFNRRQARRPQAAFAFGASLVLFVEVAQMFIRSHSATSTDVIVGWTGVGLGLWIGTRASARVGVAPAPASGPLSWRILLAVALWSLLLCAYHWLPYDFGMNGDMIRQKLGRMSLLPFAGYSEGSYLNAFNNLAAKSALAVPLGVIGAFACGGRTATSALARAAWLFLAAAIFAIIEAGQLVLPGRVPDPTDVLVGVVATYVGLRAGSWLQGPGTYRDVSEE